ncbi:MAG: nucleoside deaminase [Acidobacteriota bacterium]|nr:nucleoside deaminase [Acidobacteriota bacterium]
MEDERDKKFMLRAIELARQGVDSNLGGPFGAVIVKDGRIIGEGCNRVTSTNDPTAHAEIVAIRNACLQLNSFSLEGAAIYTSCEPCPMCLGAIYWARIKKIFYACTRKDAASIGFDDDFIYKEINLFPEKRSIKGVNFMREEAMKVFKMWEEKPDKIPY